MQPKEITLGSKEELKIFMNPQRQQVLRMMSISGKPATAKMIADRMGFSASAAQHHLKKLMQIGLVEQDHTEVINGITAVYFKLTGVLVHIGLQMEDELSNERSIMMQNMVSQVYSGFFNCLDRAKKQNIREEDLKKYGDVATGVAHLTQGEAEELLQLIHEFMTLHDHPGEDTQAWEYALIAYNTKLEETLDASEK
jgi:predicted ArsR family transcriptional regulator